MFNTTLRNNSATTGGAIQLSSSIVTLESCFLLGNIATSDGGAIYMDSYVSTVSLVGCLFDTNAVKNIEYGAADITIADSANLVVRSICDQVSITYLGH